MLNEKISTFFLFFQYFFRNRDFILFPFQNHEIFHDFDSRRRRRMGMHETDFMPFHGMKWRVR